MPASEFEAALAERVDYAVFVAYDTWAREVGYSAHNPYDVLARLLDGLPQALSAAVADRGGWSALDPTGGMPNEAARHLVSSMAAQVVTARIQAESAHTPEVGLLTGLIVDAVSGAITVFVHEPGTFELAGAEAPSGVSLGHRAAPPPATHEAEPAPMPLAALPEPDPVGDLAPLPEVHTAAATGSGSDPSGWLEAWLYPYLSFFFGGIDPSMPVIVIGSSGQALSVDRNGSVDQIDLVHDWSRPEDTVPIAHNPTPSVPGPGPSDVLPLPPISGGGPGGGSGGGSDGGSGGGRTDVSDVIAALIARWEAALENAAFYRVENGSAVRLSDTETAQVIDTLIARVVEQAMQSLGGSPTPPPPPPPQVIDPTPPLATLEHHDSIFPG